LGVGPLVRRARPADPACLTDQFMAADDLRERHGAHAEYGGEGLSEGDPDGAASVRDVGAASGGVVFVGHDGAGPSFVVTVISTRLFWRANASAKTPPGMLSTTGRVEPTPSTRTMRAGATPRRTSRSRTACARAADSS
ncbi:hypothetical protein STRIP9103_00200, partial [Streptomyces ipomoeae 91-03]